MKNISVILRHHFTMQRTHRRTKWGQYMPHEIMNSFKSSKRDHSIPPSLSYIPHATGLPYSTSITFVLIQRLHWRHHLDVICPNQLAIYHVKLLMITLWVYVILMLYTSKTTPTHNWIMTECHASCCYWTCD